MSRKQRLRAFMGGSDEERRSREAHAAAVWGRRFRQREEREAREAREERENEALLAAVEAAERERAAAAAAWDARAAAANSRAQKAAARGSRRGFSYDGGIYCEIYTPLSTLRAGSKICAWYQLYL